MRLAMNFTLLTPYPLLLLVLWALGLSMIVLAALIHLPRRGPARRQRSRHRCCTTRSTACRRRSFGALAGVWNVLHQPGVFFLGGMPVVRGLPADSVVRRDGARFRVRPGVPAAAGGCRREFLNGARSCLRGFLVLRAVNVYGDPSPWSSQPSPLFTVLSFLQRDEVSALARSSC